MNHTKEFYGYRRPDGSVGVRNHVAVISVMDNVNPVVSRITSLVKGTVPVLATFGRGMRGEAGKRHDRTLIGFGQNSNVAASLVISLEPKTAREIADAIAETGKPVSWLAIEKAGGTLRATADGARMALKMVTEVGKIRREPVPLSELMVGVECGGTDPTSGIASNPATGQVSDWLVESGSTVILSEPTDIIGGEEFLLRNAASQEVREKLLAMVRRCENRARQLGLELTNFSPDHIAGGLTTLEEKSIGAVKKGGSTPLQEVIGPAFRPSKKGLVFMDAEPAGTENITSLAAGGAEIILFTTGAGNPIACPISPTIKVCGNPNTVIDLNDNIDVDVSSIIKGERTILEAAESIYEELLYVANGQMTRSEALSDVEVSISGYCDFSSII